MSYKVVESDINGTVIDFIRFCDFIETNRTSATKKGDLSTKGCYAINQLLSHPLKTAKQTDRMHHYPSVSLWFFIAKEAGLIEFNSDNGSKLFFNTTDAYRRFKEMSMDSQYILIFNTWFCFVDYSAQYNERGSSYMMSQSIDTVFAQLGAHSSVKWIERNQEAHRVFNSSPVQFMMVHYYKIAHNLMDLGLLIFTEGNLMSEYYNNPVIDKIKPTQLGCCIMRACKYRKYAWFNVYVETVCDADEIDIYEDIVNALEANEEIFLTPFLTYFHQENIDIEAINTIIYGYDKKGNDIRIFEIKVSLDSKCYRIIRCLPEHTFESLHLAIQEAFNFNNDHLYSFYLDGKCYSSYSVNSPYSERPPYSDEICLSDMRLKDKQHILYLFDYGEQWEFKIVLNIKTDESISLKKPEIIKSVGKAPEQYPDYEEF